MTLEEINNFEKVQAQLESLHSEISLLTKKSSNDALNKFKLKFVNYALKEGNNVLGYTYRPFSDFEEFDENDLPSNSDVTMILGQYLNCMEKLRSDNSKQIFSTWYWIADGEQTSIRTASPKKLKEK